MVVGINERQTAILICSAVLCDSVDVSVVGLQSTAFRDRVRTDSRRRFLADN